MAIVFAAALLLFAAIVLTLHILGFRYVTCHRLDGNSVRFAGRVGSDGAPVLGVVLFPDGSKATVDRSDGSFVYSNGSRYSGRLDSVFEREGQGSITLKNGDSYTGDFLHDRLSGHGVYRFANGDVYEGDFVENKKQGFGKYTYADGEIYEGGFYDDMRHGQGKMSKPDGARMLTLPPVPKLQSPQIASASVAPAVAQKPPPSSITTLFTDPVPATYAPALTTTFDDVSSKLPSSCSVPSSTVASPFIGA